MNQRLFPRPPGQQKQAADHDDNQHGNGNNHARHGNQPWQFRQWDSGIGKRLLPEPRARCIAPAIMLQKHIPAIDSQSKPIVLVGLMGVGKSTVGRRLALKLALPFVDADTEIEAAAGMTITEIFEKFGEPYFRDGERRVIARLIDGTPKVIATGGGAFINDETRELILDQAIAVWLDANPRVLAERVSRRDTRPLLRNRNQVEVLTELARVRNPIYALAPIHVASHHAPHEATVTAILKALRA